MYLKKKLVLAEPTCPLMVFPFKLVVYLLTSLTLIGTASYLTVKVLQQKDPCTPPKCGLFWVHLYRMVTLLYLFLLGTSGPKTAHVPPSPLSHTHETLTQQVQSSKTAKLQYMVLDSDRFVVCKGIQLKNGTLHQTLKGTTYPKFSYLAIAVYKLSALANHKLFSQCRKQQKLPFFDSKSFVVCKVIQQKISKLHQDITGYNNNNIQLST